MGWIPGYGSLQMVHPFVSAPNFVSVTPMEYYSAIRKNEFMKFLGKCLDLQGIILSEVTQSQKNSNDMYSLISGYQPRNLEYPRYKIQFAKHMKLKKNKDQSADTLPLLKIGNKTPMEGVTETKFGAETKGWTIQRLPYPGIHPIISFQTLTPLHTLVGFCCKDPDIAVSCETMPGFSKHISRCSQSAIGWITGPPMEELEEVPKE